MLVKKVVLSIDRFFVQIYSSYLWSALYAKFKGIFFLVWFGSDIIEPVFMSLYFFLKNLEEVPFWI